MSDQDPFPGLERPLTRGEREAVAWLIGLSAAISTLGVWKFLELIGVL